TDVITANVKEPAEDAARRMSRYGFYALPVVDDRGRMVGIFTGDDAQTVLREEDTRDVLALGGVSGDGDSYLGSNIWSLFRRRIVWLLALFIAETITGMVLRHYGQNGGEDLKLNPLIFFVPLLIGAGGNVGSQVTTTITRALALGEVGTRDAVRVLRRELVVATLIGLTLGAVGFARAFFGWSSGLGMSGVVGVALPAIVIWSASVGSLLPLAAKRLGIDPAVMSAPFISTFVDATGLIIYFEIAQWFVRLGWLTITV
ncbi:MAG TPA: magnesium transporter, partial [Fimbriimonadaceae bacterium]|nr:magnesium transporter [Fimbriimonadaceae bacterium]